MGRRIGELAREGRRGKGHERGKRVKGHERKGKEGKRKT